MKHCRIISRGNPSCGTHDPQPFDCKHTSAIFQVIFAPAPLRDHHHSAAFNSPNHPLVRPSTWTESAPLIRLGQKLTQRVGLPSMSQQSKQSTLSLESAAGRAALGTQCQLPHMA
jgi:hypothetical protein